MSRKRKRKRKRSKRSNKKRLKDPSTGRRDLIKDGDINTEAIRKD